VALAALGKREVDEPDCDRDLSPSERAAVRRQALSVVVRSTLIAALAAAIAWVV
jgi:hypothetical protein